MAQKASCCCPKASLVPCNSSEGDTYTASAAYWKAKLGAGVTNGDVFFVEPAGGSEGFCATYTVPDVAGNDPVDAVYTEVSSCSDAQCVDKEPLWYFKPCTPPEECDELNRNVYIIAALESDMESLLPGIASGSLDATDPSTYAGTWKVRMLPSVEECNGCVDQGAGDYPDHCSQWCGFLSPIQKSDPVCYENTSAGTPTCPCCDEVNGRIQICHGRMKLEVDKRGRIEPSSSKRPMFVNTRIDASSVEYELVLQ